jgi:radical SAM superfamily enzyme YgiQ (UPF0313 family)
MWPFNSESSSFWQPLGFASIAAVLKENDIPVEILDTLALKIGWKSLEKELEKRDFDIIGIGEETASSNEGIKLAHLAKRINPDCTVIAGGYHYPYVSREVMEEHPFDFIVKGEGEMTFLKLVQELEKKNTEFKSIEGIFFKDKEGRIIETKDRELIRNLDELPIPAYELLPMEKYGEYGNNHPKLAAIEHSRGCVDSCSFCSLWKQMSYKGKSCYRTKSVERVMEEVDILVKKYHRKTLGWVDGTFNADPAWNSDWADAMLERNYNVWSTTWARADRIVRDEKLGILKKQVDAGIVQMIIGVERVMDTDLAQLNKHNNSFCVQNDAFTILKKYPSVFTIASYIYGLPDETKASLKNLRKVFMSDLADFSFLLPYTPYPGTKEYMRVKTSGGLEVRDFSCYNLHIPVMSSHNFSRKYLQMWFTRTLALNALKQMPKNLYAGMSIKDERRRNAKSKLVKASAGIILNAVTNSKRLNEYGIKPQWYDS